MYKYKHQELKEEIIKAARDVQNVIRYGFLEKVYHNAMDPHLRKSGLEVESEKSTSVAYG